MPMQSKTHVATYTPIHRCITCALCLTLLVIVQWPAPASVAARSLPQSLPVQITAANLGALAPISAHSNFPYAGLCQSAGGLYARTGFGHIITLSSRNLAESSLKRVDTRGSTPITEAFSADCVYFMRRSGNPGSIGIWRTRDGSPVAEVTMSQPVAANQSSLLALAPNARTLVVAGRTLERITLSDGKAIQTRSVALQPRMGLPLAMSPDAQTLVYVAANTRSVFTADTVTGAVTEFNHADDNPVQASISQDGTLLVQYATGQIIAWDLATGSLLDDRWKVNAPGARIRSLGATRFMLLAPGDAAYVGQLSSESVLSASLSMPVSLQDASLADDGKSLLLMSDSALERWSLAPKKLQARAARPGYHGIRQWTLENRFLGFADAATTTVDVIDYTNGKRLNTLRARNPVVGILAQHGLDQITALTTNHTFEFWDPATGGSLRPPQPVVSSAAARPICFASNGGDLIYLDQLAPGDGDARSALRRVPSVLSPVAAAAFATAKPAPETLVSSDSIVAVSGCQSGRLAYADASEVRIITLDGKQISSVAFPVSTNGLELSADGRYLLMQSDALGVAKVIDVETRKTVFVEKGASHVSVTFITLDNKLYVNAFDPAAATLTAIPEQTNFSIQVPDGSLFTNLVASPDGKLLIGGLRHGNVVKGRYAWFDRIQNDQPGQIAFWGTQQTTSSGGALREIKRLDLPGPIFHVEISVNQRYLVVRGDETGGDITVWAAQVP